MATAIAVQLAKTRAQSSNSFDLKAHKRAHSQSLLFDSRVAGTQEFEDIYLICREGFEDLCILDPRFLSFANNVFSEQSKHEDRTQMTAAQNQQLDGVLEKFLGLVGSKLLLKPAYKCVEWLVRRFRIHEHNTSCFVLTFLPYHLTAIFPTVLSILPPNLPPALKFLHPYVQSLANPPRQAIVYTASQNRSFFAALNGHVMKTSRLDNHHRALISFWASVTTEAVAAMLDRARSAIRESQKQNQEDIILSLLPTMNEGLASKGLPDLRVGCYMVLTVLASKVNLDDEVVTAMMEALTTDWATTSHAGLICLCALAQQRESVELPRKVFKAVVGLKNFVDDLTTIQGQYQVDRLVLGVVLGVISNLHKTKDPLMLYLVRSLMEANLMDKASIMAATRAIVSIAQSLRSEHNSTQDMQGPFDDLITHLIESASTGTLMETTITELGLDLGQLRKNLKRKSDSGDVASGQTVEKVTSEDVGGQQLTNSLEVLLKDIPTRTAHEISFLSFSESHVFESLARAFSLAATTEPTVNKFSEMPVLQRTLAMGEPLFFSFYVRVWCDEGMANVRAASMQTVSNYLEKESLTADVQILLPYLIFALADPSAKVRRAATKLALGLSRAYTKVTNEANKAHLPILGHDSIYGQGKETKTITWLSLDDVLRFMDGLLVPGLQECRVDQGHISKVLSDSLNGSKQSRGSSATRKELSTSLRLSVFGALCSHVNNMPSYRVKSRLVPMLNQITKIGSISRTRFLSPLLSQFSALSEEDYQQICGTENLNGSEFLDHVSHIITASDRDGIECLKNVVSRTRPLFPAFRAAILNRMIAVWPHMKSDVQKVLANSLLEQTLRELKVGEREDQKFETMETLRSLPLSTGIFQSFLEALPSITISEQEKVPAPKRRRIQHEQMAESTRDLNDLPFAIKHIILILEMIEDSKPEGRPELLKGLFQVTSQLHQAQNHPKITTDYPLILAIDSMLAIVRRAELSTDLNIDHTAIRTDILVDCIRTTVSPQVRNSTLLLVAALATVTPGLVLHSVMPIFTYMGTSFFRQDNDFSAYVLKQTMESIIPRLVQSLQQRKYDPFDSICELLLSFATAFEHIPTQRRFQLFTSLVDKLGSSEYLFALLTILVHKYPNDRIVLQFAVDLTSACDVDIRLQTIGNLIDVVLDTQKSKRSLSISLLEIGQDINLDSPLINLLQLPLLILNDPTLSSRIWRKLAGAGNDVTVLRTSYQQMLEKTLILSDRFKNNKILIVPCGRILDASLALLPMSDLVDTLQSLLKHQEDQICRQALVSFERRLTNEETSQKEISTACLAFLPRLLHIIRESSDISLKGVAVGSVDKITEKFGRKAISVVIECAHTISSDICLKAAKTSLRIAALLCLASIVEVAGEKFVSAVPDAMPKAIDNLAVSVKGDTDDTDLHDAAFTFLSSILLYVPWAIEGANLDRLLSVSYDCANAEMGESCNYKRLEAMRLIPERVEAQECFAALKRTWTTAMTKGSTAVKDFIGIIRLAIVHYGKSTIRNQCETLGDLCLGLFDLRRIQLSHYTEKSFTSNELEIIEDAASDVAITMIYKLNDAAFRPLFARMSEWTSTLEVASKEWRLHRQTTWYRFLSKFFDRLKSIVTNYAEFILDDVVATLMNACLAEDKQVFLWRQVVFTLHKTFEHDQDDFYRSPVHFGPISNALLSQLAKAAQVPVLPEVIPAIAELAVATDSATHHKEMNNVILQLFRSDSAAIRLGAVQCEKALTERLGEEWLELLPEMLPYISEALEDDDEVVEKEVQRWVVSIEKFLGESISSMLQ